MGRNRRRGASAASAGADTGGVERGRWSSRRKAEVVVRILRGEDLDALSRELGVTSARLAEWRDAFLAGGQTAMRSRAADHRDEENQRLKAKVGELMMEVELLNEKIDLMEAGRRPPQGRPRR